MNEGVRARAAAVLEQTRRAARRLPLEDDRFVIFSDLHMGNGGSRDDFRRNGPRFRNILAEYYLPREYHLILNGDIEELQKFTWEQIRRFWQPLYEVFGRFDRTGRLHKILGNHDGALAGCPFPYPYEVTEGVNLIRGGKEILVYHGHQFSDYLRRFEALCRYSLQYLAYPLGIMNRSKSPDSRKKLKTEVKAYEASRRLGLISVIGHTHRPLFESLSKRDSLRYRIDGLVRAFRGASREEQDRIARDIQRCREELTGMKDASEFHISGLYSSEGLLPCLFNSGCAIGKRGITCLEICREEIRLVYWFDSAEGPPGPVPAFGREALPRSSLGRIVLNRETLDYILDKMRLMTPRPSPSGPDTSLPFQPLPD